VKVLITGSDGFIGKCLMHSFKSEYELIGMDFPDDIRNPKIVDEYIAKYKPDVICHHAALTSVPDSYGRIEKTYQTNVNGTINLLTSAKKYDVKKFVFASSSSTKGESPYGKSKLMAENIIKDCGIPHAILTYFNVFGPTQPLRAVIPVWVKAVIANEELSCNGSWNISRDFTYIENIIEANRVAISSSKVGHFEVGSGESISLEKCYQTIKKYFNENHDMTKLLEPRQGDIQHSLSDKDKWICEPKVSFEEGILKWASQ